MNYEIYTRVGTSDLFAFLTIQDGLVNSVRFKLCGARLPQLGVILDKQDI